MINMLTPPAFLFQAAVTTVGSNAAVGLNQPASLPLPYILAPIGALLALSFAFIFYRSLMSHSEGDSDMIHIAKAVREGAQAYLKRQYAIVAVVFICLIGALLILSLVLNLQPWLSAIGVPIAGLLSGLCGFFGMKTATNASARTAAAAKKSLDDGLRVAFRAGSVMGLCVTGFALLDVTVWFFILTQIWAAGTLVTITTVMLSYGMGASLQALFARVGGGIYTKAADVGADLVGKVEAGIPEDDARNPATIADNVGDNVGDVAGMGADLYESYYDSILASLALAAAAAFHLSLDGSDAMRLIVVPPVLAGIGIIAAIIGIFTVRSKQGANMTTLLRALRNGVWISSALIVVGSAGTLYWLLGSVPGVSWWGLWLAIVAGLVAGLIIAWGTEFYTSYDYKPTRRIGEQAETGPATLIISGISEGMGSTWIPLLTVVIAILIAFVVSGGDSNFLMGVLGVGLAAVGMLSTLAITLATDAYGPIADNAGGNAEMTHQPDFVRERTDMLDSLGNTTAATGKGFAIGSAALTALALLAAYVITVQANLTKQAQAMPAIVSQENPVAYVNHGVFKIYNPQDQSADAGLLITLNNNPKILEALDSGKIPKVSYDSQRNLYSAKINTGIRTTEFNIVPAASASVESIMNFYQVTLTNPRVICGLFIGVMIIFVFCSMTMNAVGRAAHRMMHECRRQFAIMKTAFKKQGLSDEQISDPLQWPFHVEHEGHQYPDYASCVQISTRGAQREMVLPSVMAVVVPIAVGLVLGVPGVMGLLAGAITSGFAVAIFMSNSGGAWDNAKKWIETGAMGGKGSDAHKAGVVGDTVGDPFKDTSGPSLNILIKLLSIVSVVFAGLIVKFSPVVVAFLHLK